MMYAGEYWDYFHLSLTDCYLEIQVEQSHGEPGGQQHPEGQPRRGRGVVDLHTTQAYQPTQ